MDDKIKTTRKGRVKKNGKKKRQLNRAWRDDNEDEEDAFNICLVCCKHFANSRPNEDWVQCIGCNYWDHEACTPGEKIYICQNCDSDMDDAKLPIASFKIKVAE